MELILNDISWCFPCHDRYEAIKLVKQGIEILNGLRKRDPSFRLSSRGKLSGYELAPGYCFEQLFHVEDDVLNRNYKSLLKSFFINFNQIKDECGYFEWERIRSEQCGYAYAKRKAVFSIPFDDRFAQEQLNGIFESLDVQRTEATLANVFNTGSVQRHHNVLESRIYEANPKHMAGGWGSPMDLNDETAQLVLNCATPVNQDPKHLAALYRGTYYSFRCHLNNAYHGYQDTGLPESVKRHLADCQASINKEIVDYAR